MAKNIYTLPEDGFRIRHHPMAVQGFYKRYRTFVQYFLFALFSLLPWVKINNLPAVLFDIPNRRFAFFGINFWGHDTPVLFFILTSFSLGLAFVTAVWGRAWCGWACPQTVFIDGIFRRTEAFIEGNHIARTKLQNAPLNKEKIIKKTAKWFLFFLISSFLAHTLLSYFFEADKLVSMMASSPLKNRTPFLIVSLTTIVILFNFGWFREQFCIIMCPYGRLQSVLMDENSLTIVYDEKRGEPRRGRHPETSNKKMGDCINCYKCVAVCPTGIDIRCGNQMECIACTSCIDACDDVMVTTKKPSGLIRYDSENGLNGKQTKFWRMRSFTYLGLTLLSITGLSLFVSSRSDLDITIVRASESPYQVFKRSEQNTFVTNHFKLHIKNQSLHTMDVFLQQTENPEDLDTEIIAPTFPAKIPPGKTTESHIYIKFPESALNKQGQKIFPLYIHTIYGKTTQKYRKDINLVGPVK